VATTLPALNRANATAVRGTGTPSGASRVGDHEELTTRTPNAANEAAHNSAVLHRRPGPNSSPTGARSPRFTTPVNSVVGPTSASGATRASTRRTRWAGTPLATSETGDSGNSAAMSPATTSGVRPPTRNSPRHPVAGIIRLPNSPHSTPPTGNPVNSTPAMVARCRAATSSEARLTAHGMAAPRPSPVRNRYTSRAGRLAEVTVTSVNTAKQSTAVTRTVLRPTRSASGARPIPPSAMPATAAENTVPSAAVGMRSDPAMNGAASPMICRSNPSSSTTSAQSTTANTRTGPTRDRSSTSATSTRVVLVIVDPSPLFRCRVRQLIRKS
jgi:hypothetical protein